MFTSIISDCKGENEAGRQITRLNSLGLGPATIIGVDSGLGFDATIQAGANLIDILDSCEGRTGLIVLNVAPRGDKQDGENGTPFCYFYYKKTLIISTIKGYSLSFIKKFKLADRVNLIDTREVLEFASKNKLIDKELSSYIIESQFRSFDFVPRIAKWLMEGVEIPYKIYSLEYTPEPPGCIWCIDAFGNAKLTITNQDLEDFIKNDPISLNPPQANSSQMGVQTIKTNLGVFPFYRRLKDIPKGEVAAYIGSSGINSDRFLEIAAQGVSGSAAQKLNLHIGTEIKLM